MASELRPHDITSLLFQSRGVPRAFLKALFREGLAIKGFKRGQIPLMLLSDDGEVTPLSVHGEGQESRMISRCSAEELGAYLVFLLR